MPSGNWSTAWSADGVMALVAAGPWSPSRARRGPSGGRTRSRSGSPRRLRRPARPHAGPHRRHRAASRTSAALLLGRLARGPLTVVLTTSDQPSPFGGPELLRESLGTGLPHRRHPGKDLDGTAQPTRHPSRGDALPGRALLALREQALDRDELIGLVAPRGLTEAMDSIAAADDGSRPAQTRMTCKTGWHRHRRRPRSTRCASLGVVEQRRQPGHAERGAAADWKKPSDVSPDGMCRVLLDAVLSADPEAPDVSHERIGGPDAGRGPAAHAPGSRCARSTRSKPPAGASGRGFADRQIGGPRPGAQGQLAGPEPRAMAALPPLGVLPRPGPAGGPNGLIPDASEALHPATARAGAGRLRHARFRRAVRSGGADPGRRRAASRSRPAVRREIMRCFPAGCPSRCSNWRRTDS